MFFFLSETKALARRERKPNKSCDILRAYKAIVHMYNFFLFHEKVGAWGDLLHLQSVLGRPLECKKSNKYIQTHTHNRKKTL